MINRVTVEGFRGVRGRLSLEFAKLTLLAGRNGLGKTTVFDAIDWCLFGPSSRLGGDVQTLTNLYAGTGSPAVSIDLVLTSGIQVRIERTKLGVTWNGSALTDRDLATELVTDADIFPPHAREPGERVRQLCYLPQETLRDLVSEGAQDTRAGLFDALAGVPYAAVVTTSLRKVRERLSGRERGVAESVHALSKEQQDLLERRENLGARLEHAEGPLLARVAELLDLGSAAQISPGEALRLARERLSEIVQRQLTLGETESFVRAMEEEVAEIKARLEKGRSKRADVQGETDAALAQLEQLESTLSQLESKQTTLEREAVGLREQARAVRRRIEAAAEIEELRGRLVNAELLTGELSRRVEDAEAVSLEAKTSVDSSRREVDALLARRRDLITSRQLARAVEEVRRRLEASRQSQVVLAARLRELSAESERLKASLANARVTEREAEERLAGMARRSTAREELRQHLERAAVLATALGLESCPLCGVAHADKDALAARMASTMAKQPGSEPEDLRAARLAAENSKAATAEAEALLRRALADLDSGERSMSGNQEELGSLISSLKEHEGGISESASSGEVEREIASCETQMVEVREKLQRLEHDQVQRKEELSALASQRLRADETLARLKAEILEGEVQAARDVQSAQLTAPPDELEAAARRLHESAEEITSRLEALRRERSALQDRITSQRAEEAQLRSQEAAATQRLELADREVSNRVRSVFPSARPDTETSHAPRLKAETDHVASLRASLEGEIPGLETLVLLREQAERAARLAVLAAEIAQLRAKEAELQRASDRFAELAAAIERRRGEEGRDAIGQLQATIQECLRGLSAYRHLDNIELNSAGALRLSDDSLHPRSVAPDVYTSVGQQNVLALAVFLALSLRESVSTLGVIFLDEPVQNLDDLNFLAFTALLKRIIYHRQVVFSTADRNVETIVARQLRTWSREEFAHYVWEAFTPEKGPRVRRVDRPSMRIARAAGA